MTDPSDWQFAAYNTIFVKSREEWFTAMIMANYSKTDNEILRNAVDGWKNSVIANIEYHEEMARLMKSKSPAMSRQHSLLAAIYKEIRPTLNSG